MRLHLLMSCAVLSQYDKAITSNIPDEYRYAFCRAKRVFDTGVEDLRRVKEHIFVCAWE